MRVLSSKIHCPSSICFSKPSAAATHLYDSGPLKLDNSPHVPCVPQDLPPVAVAQQNQVKEETSVEEEEEEEGVDTLLKSCIKKVPPPASSSSLEKKKVQWIDSLGKQLVDIKEFESSETGDSDNEEENGGCLCNIL